LETDDGSVRGADGDDIRSFQVTGQLALTQWDKAGGVDDGVAGRVGGCDIGGVQATGSCKHTMGV
jgi:hypothetical protein